MNVSLRHSDGTTEQIWQAYLCPLKHPIIIGLGTEMVLFMQTPSTLKCLKNRAEGKADAIMNIRSKMSFLICYVCTCVCVHVCVHNECEQLYMHILMK